MTMRERVARALADAERKLPANMDVAEFWTAIAIAAIQAMRLPTYSMIQAGYDAIEDGLPLKKIYTAIVDAALAEGE